MTYKNILDLFYEFRNQHPILSGTTFSWGNLSDYSREDYITKYPAIHFVPTQSIIDQTQNTFNWSVLIYDLLNEYVGTEDQSNQIYAMSIAHEILYDFYAWFANNLTDYGFYILTPITYNPFVDRFNQSVAGVEAQIQILVDQIACIPPFVPQPSPSPTPVTATPTMTPTITPTITPSITPTLTPSPSVCPTITQYLEVEVFDNTKFKLLLWNDAGFTSQAESQCNYIFSGTAFGSLGTTYTGTEVFPQGDHAYQFDLAPVLLPGEVVVGFDVLGVEFSGCTCPVNVILPPAENSLVFLVASGATSIDACGNLITGTTFNVYAEDLGNCAPCLPNNCWACLNAGQVLYYDFHRTLPVNAGYYANDMGTSNNYWLANGSGELQGGGFGSC
jgi:hypothetical protein